MDTNIRFLAVIQEALELEQPITDMNLRFKEDLNVDSIDMLSMIMLLEDELNIDIEPDQLEKLSTIQDVVDFFVEK